MKDGNNKNGLYILVGVLVIALAVLAFLFMQEKNEPDLSISVGEDGIEVDTDG